MARVSTDDILEYNTCKLCGKFLASSKRPTASTSATNVSSRRKRDVSVSFPGNETVRVDNDVIKVTGNLIRLEPDIGANGTQIPRFKFHFRNQ